MIKFQYLILFSVLVFAGCSKSDNEMFRLVPASESGVTFRNIVAETPEFNILNYLYFYNGGGVSTGDVNGDGRPDLYFTANQQSNKLYLNEGNLKFKDITEQAGVAGLANGWKTGVTMADVNGDGRLDLYVSYLGEYLIYKGKNQLFINEGNDANGIPKFSDKAIEFGLDLIGFSTQAAFLDYDKDGDLDMFMLTHSVHQNSTYGRASMRFGKHPLAGDRLLKNDNGKFVDVTDGSGIYNSVIGYGLGVVVGDVNLDGWPDIYVGNDFHENDYLYLNNGDGTFSEKLESQIQHTSRYTMGVDIGDFNNDLFPDIISNDMLSEDPAVVKSSVAEDPYDVYNYKITFGYNHQFSRNNLQLNNEDGTFSEIALFSGVAATDWSWASLFADFNLDTRADIFVTNGIKRRFNDLDYISFIAPDSIRMRIEGDAPMTEQELDYVRKMPEAKISNYLFINNGDSTFTNKLTTKAVDVPSFSNGAAYADLDGDGDLDLVANNLEDEAFVYENKTIDKLDDKKKSTNHYLQFSLKGNAPNLFGVGTKVITFSGGTRQIHENNPTRGFQSSVDFIITVGLGTATVADSLFVIWPDDSYQQLTKVPVDTILELHQKDASGKYDYNVFHKKATLFSDVTKDVVIPYTHVENKFTEFVREPLIPEMFSREGPASAVADVNGDGYEDIFLGGAKWEKATILLQQPGGKFVSLAEPDVDKDNACEDVDAMFFDADLDGDQDLVVVSGGNEFGIQSPNNSPRLYLNNGKGAFTRSTGMPAIHLTGSCVDGADIDGDGDIDLFIGARTVPWHYGIKPDSYVLTNDGKGNFTDVTTTVAPELLKFGFVKDATWTDIDNDHHPDLVVAAEWSPITIFYNKGGKLTKGGGSQSGLDKTNGWWNVITAVDVDKDGDMDLIAGNLGENSKLKPSLEEPVGMYVSDFDNNDSTDQVLTYYFNHVEYPFNTRDELTKQMPYLKKRYLSYHNFADAPLHEMFSSSELASAQRYYANTFATSIVENLGQGNFAVRPLPKAAQFSEVQAIRTGDYNGDGNVDIIIAGNFYPVNVQLGRYDASYGLLLVGNGHGVFKDIPAFQSGISLRGEIRALREIVINGRKVFLAIRNNDTVLSFAKGSAVLQ